MTAAFCNAGRNYLYLAHTGKVARCTCRETIAHEWVGDINDWKPPIAPAGPCAYMANCERSFLGDWNRSSRMGGGSPGWRRGEFSADPVNELVAKLNLTGICNYDCFYCKPGRLHAQRREERPAGEWRAFMRRMREHFARCFYHVQGTVGEPFLYDGLLDVLTEAFVLGDHVHPISNLSGHDSTLDAVLAAANPSVLRFGASAHPSQPRFDMDAFASRVRRIKDAGYYVEVTLVGVPTQLYLLAPVRDHFAQWDVPVRMFYASCQPATARTTRDFGALMEKSASGKTVIL